MIDLYRQIIVRGWIVAGLFGAFAYWMIVGFSLVDGTNIAWIFGEGDIAAVQTGWTFFRNAPWSLRIASNPHYGMDFGGSIIFSDAIPLMAIVFKALSPFLPADYQYLGLWVLFSFILQGVFGWLLTTKFTEHPYLRILSGLIFSLTPLYAYRFTSCTHMSLTAHWLILASLYLCLPPQPRRPMLGWALVLAISAFVHIYLFAMVAALWCADVLRRLLIDFRGTWIEPIAVSAIVAGLIWSTGVWSGPTGVFQGGFTWFKMNVFALIDPNAWIDSSWGKWSYVLPDIPNWGGDYEGFAYVGLGGLILFAIAAWALPAAVRLYPRNSFYPYLPLALVLVGMGIFAISQNVTFGTTNFWIWWPEPLRKLGELFRSTGRFIWPLYYFLFIAALFIVMRTFAPRTAMMILAGVAVIQAVDTAPGWMQDRAYLLVKGGPYQTKLTSRFWKEAATRYGAVRIAPHDNNHRFSLDVATMARPLGMVTDAVYLSRTSTLASEASRARVERGIATGEWPRDTLFVVDEDVARRASAKLDRTRSQLVRVDGYIALAPEWQGCTDCGAVPYQ